MRKKGKVNEGKYRYKMRKNKEKYEKYRKIGKDREKI